MRKDVILGRLKQKRRQDAGATDLRVVLYVGNYRIELPFCQDAFWIEASNEGLIADSGMGFCVRMRLRGVDLTTHRIVGVGRWQRNRKNRLRCIFSAGQAGPQRAAPLHESRRICAERIVCGRVDAGRSEPRPYKITAGRGERCPCGDGLATGGWRRLPVRAFCWGGRGWR